MNPFIIAENERKEKMIGYLARMVLALGIGQLSADELSAIAKVVDEFGGIDIDAKDILAL